MFSIIWNLFRWDWFSSSTYKSDDYKGDGVAPEPKSSEEYLPPLVLSDVDIIVEGPSKLTLLNLPREVLFKIFDHARVNELGKLSSVCKTMYQIFHGKGGYWEHYVKRTLRVRLLTRKDLCFLAGISTESDVAMCENMRSFSGKFSDTYAVISDRSLTGYGEVVKLCCPWYSANLKCIRIRGKKVSLCDRPETKPRFLLFGYSAATKECLVDEIYYKIITDGNPYLQLERLHRPDLMKDQHVCHILHINASKREILNMPEPTGVIMVLNLEPFEEKKLIEDLEICRMTLRRIDAAISLKIKYRAIADDLLSYRHPIIPPPLAIICVGCNPADFARAVDFAPKYLGLCFEDAYYMKNRRSWGMFFDQNGYDVNLVVTWLISNQKKHKEYMP